MDYLCDQVMERSQAISAWSCWSECLKPENIVNPLVVTLAEISSHPAHAQSLFQQSYSGISMIIYCRLSTAELQSPNRVLVRKVIVL